MRKNQKGFTLVELMVVLAILGIIVVGVLGLVTRQNKAYHSEEAIIDMQMSNRVAMDRLVHLVRMAGFGCQGNISSTNPIIVNGTTSFSTVITATNNSTGSDTLTLVSGLQRVGIVDNSTAPANEKLTTTTIPVIMDPNAPAFDDGSTAPYKQYFYISPAISRDFLTIVSGGAGGSNLTKTGSNITVNEGDIVYTVRPYTIRLYTDSQGITCLGIDDGGGIDSYAENIEDLQFQYGWDADNNGRITTGEWVDNPAGSESLIRAVRVQILARSAQPDRGFFDLHDDDGATAGKQYIIADHTITLNSSTEHYHRYLVETIVFIRNLNF